MSRYRERWSASVKGRIPGAWLYHVTTVLLVLTAVFFFWSTQAAWGRLDLGADRYKVGLLGVTRIFNAGSSREGTQRCGWYDAEPLAKHCLPAAEGGGAYRLVRLAPVAAAICEVAFVLAAFAHLRRGSGLTGTGLAPFAVGGAVSLVAGILMMHNVSRALAIADGRQLEMQGTGLTAAWLTAVLLLSAAALASYSDPLPQLSS
jgi:hypothetical protein